MNVLMVYNHVNCSPPATRVPLLLRISKKIKLSVSADVCCSKILLRAEGFAVEVRCFDQLGVSYRVEMVSTSKALSLLLPTIPRGPNPVLFYLPSVICSGKLDL